MGFITPVKRRSDESNIGLIITTDSMEPCVDETERLKEKLKCRTEYGLNTQLPLDIVNCEPEEICP